MSDWTLKPEQVLAENAERVKDFMRQLTRQNQYLNALYDMSLTVVNHLDVQELLQVSVEQAVSLVGAKHGYLYLVDEDSQVAVVNVACGEYTALIGLKVRKGEGFAGRIWETGEPLVVEDYNIWPGKLPGLFRDGKWDLIGVPLIIHRKVVGILGLSQLEDSSPLPRDLIQILSRFAALVAIALDNARLYEEVQRESKNRHQMEEVLLEREKQYRLLLENSYDAITIHEFSEDIEKTGKFIEVNERACRFFGYRKEELLEMSPVELLLDKGKADVYRSREELKRQGRVISEFQIAAKSGRILTAETSQILFEANGKQLIFSALRDITHRKQAEEERLRLQKKEAMLERLASLGTMVAGVAHEINQPLHALSLAIGSLQYWHRKGKQFSEEKVLEQYDRIAGQVERIANIVKHLRNFVQHSYNEETVPVYWNQVVESALDLVGVQLKNHGVTVKLNFAEELPPVLGNGGRLEEVVINILINAMQAMDKAEVSGKEITITTHADASQVYLEIEDSGPGFREEVLEKIFEPFFTTKESSEGMGLGLALVQSITVSHGGQITAHNTGNGASFIVELPIYRAEP